MFVDKRIRVGICDDEVTWQNIVKDQVCEYCKNGEISVEISVEISIFGRGEEVLQCNERLDILFLDVEMPGLDGYETAARLREMREDLKIVFVTNHLEKIYQAFRVQAYRLVDKSFTGESIADCMDSFMKERKGLRAYIKVETRDGRKAVFLDEIEYIWAEQNGIRIVTNRNDYSCKETLKRIEGELKNDFFRCHKSTIVNLKYIEKIEHEIILKDGCKLEVSRRKRKLLNEKYEEYLLRTENQAGTMEKRIALT